MIHSDTLNTTYDCAFLYPDTTILSIKIKNKALKKFRLIKCTVVCELRANHVCGNGVMIHDFSVKNDYINRFSKILKFESPYIARFI